MKKILLLLVLLLLPVVVYAEDYDVKTLIPVDTKVSVKTEKFDYNNLMYNSSIDEKGNSLITFESIKNNHVTKSFVSINVLLFGEDQRNIGFLTYCSDKDLDSNYADYELKGNSSAPFSIRVVSKYFIDGKSTKDVKYISILDDNKYCQIGGYDKYKGLTLDEIVNGATNKKSENSIDKLIIEIQEKGLMSIIVLVLVGIIVLVILIMIIGSVIKKAKYNRLTRKSVVKNDIPMEETVDLTYEDNETLEDDINTPLEGDNDKLTDEDDFVDKDDEEDSSDLTSYFN